MLSSLLGIRLLLWLGATVPTPPSSEVIESLQRVRVTNDIDAGDGFQLTFSVGKSKTLDYELLQSGALAPLTRVWIGVVLGVTPEVLIDGAITHHQLSPSNDPGNSTLTVTGSDISVLLDLEEKNDQHKNQPDFLIVTKLLLAYPQLGLLPQVTPTTDVPIEFLRTPRQHETDLRFIQRKASQNGFVFYLEPVTFGINKAYWGPETRIGLPQPALTMNMGSSTNVTTLSFSNDALAPVGARGSFVEPITKLAIPIPPLPSLRLPPLAQSGAAANRTVLLRDTANVNPAQAALSSAAVATRAPEAVIGQGQLETVRYGSVLRARRLIGVRGAGISYDGNYYIRSVTHEIATGTYTQSFSVSREGTGPLLPVVRP